MLTIKSNFINFRDKQGQEITDEDLTTLASAVLSSDIVNFRENNGTNIGHGFPSAVAPKIIGKITGTPESILIINDVSLHMTKALLEAGYDRKTIYLAFGRWEKTAVPSADRTVVSLMRNFLKANFNETFNIISLGDIFMEQKKWGLIIANPPYDKDLHLKITKKVIESCLSADTEYISIQPVRWLQDPLSALKQNSDLEKFKEVAEHIQDIEIVSSEDATRAFGGEGSLQIAMDLGIYTFTKNAQGLTLNPKDTIFNKIFEKSGSKFTFKTGKYKDNKQANFVCLTSFTGCQKRGQPAILCTNKYGAFTEGKNKDGQTFEEVKKANIRFTNGSIENQLLAIFDTAVEAVNFNNSINTTFWKYVCLASTVTNLVPLKYLPWMPSYEQSWTDKDYCNYFGITEEEWRIIEARVQQAELLWKGANNKDEV